MAKHKHAEHMIVAAQDSTIKWQFDRGNGEWRDVRKPKWYEEFNYRQKPDDAAGIRYPQRYVSADGPSRDYEFNRTSYEKGWNDAIMEFSRLNDEERRAGLKSHDQVSDTERIGYLRSLSSAQLQQLLADYDGKNIGDFNERVDAAMAPLKQPGLNVRLGAHVRRLIQRVPLENDLSVFTCLFSFSLEAKDEDEAIAKVIADN